MIRLRKPAKDDRMIFIITRKELLPMAQRSFPNLRFNKRDMRSRFRRGETYVVQKFKQSLCGFIHLFVDNDTLWVDMLAVDRRNRRNGWGKKLLERAEKVGLKKGCNSIHLHVDEQNLRAQLIYRHLGFHIVHYDSNLKCYLFRKRL